MRVLYLARSSEIAGGNRSLLSLIDGLQGQIDGVVVAPEAGTLVDTCRAKGLPCHIAPSNYMEMWKWRNIVPSLLWWQRLLARVCPDVIHANAALAARAIGWSAYVSGVPVVCHSRFDASESQLRWLFRRVPNPRIVIFNSHALQRACGGAWQSAVPGAKQVVVHNGIDVSEFSLPTQVWRRAENEVLCVGRLVPVKGFETFLHMIAKVKGRGHHFRYSIVGGEAAECPGYRTHLERLAAELDIKNVVTFHGFQDDVRPFFKRATLAVCCSDIEPFGRVLIEAMACGRAVVGTSVGGIPEVIDNGVTGLIVPPREPELLADAVERLMCNRKLRESMEAAGQRRVQTCFSSEQHYRGVLDVYRIVQDGCSTLSVNYG